jgi:Galactose oxidase, central domain/Kelch motif
MPDQTPFEARLTDAYARYVAAASVAVDPRIVAATVAAGSPSRSLGWPNVFTLGRRVAVATVIAMLVVGGTFYLIQRDQLAVGGPSPTPGASASPSESASPSAGPSPSVVAPRAASWTATGSMAHPSAFHTATLLRNGKVLVAGDSASPTLAQLYDPATGTWTATGKMVTTQEFGTATLLPDGKVLVAGGGSEFARASAELYDPGSGSWTATGSMTTPRQGHTATLLLDGRVLVAGGINVDGKDNAHLASAELYDPATGIWTRTGSMVATRFKHAATLLPDGRVLVAGGGGSGSQQFAFPSAELYDPGTGTWTATGNMTTGRVQPTATLLRDGRVLVAAGRLVAAGVGGTGAELYDPGSGTWTATGPMTTTAAVVFSATLLLDGRVLLAGGWANDVDAQTQPIALASAELYDPTSGTWTATASMAIPRMGHTATLLPDGRVLVAGGRNAGFGSLASAELYDPGSP